MTKFTVVLESHESERSKRVTVIASDACEAMAIAQMKYRGWYPVDVVAA